MATGDIHEGGCLCGAVRYRAVAGESKTVTHCYCHMCRKATGGTFVTWVEYPAKSFVFTTGQPNYFRSSDLAERAFCGSCGCQLTFQAVGDPGKLSESIWIALGGTDRPGDIEPTHHIFTDDRPPWLHLIDDLPCWPSQLPWLRQEDELPRPTVPEENRNSQRTGAGADDGVREGGCLCGSVRYRGIVDSSHTVGHCHCGLCRKTTGATLVNWIHFPVKDFTFTKGQPKRFRSSPIAERTFCGTCGCQFTFQFTGDETKNLWVALGSTDRPEAFEPTHEIFTEDQIPWLNLGDGLKRWPGQRPGLRTDDSLTSHDGNEQDS